MSQTTILSKKLVKSWIPKRKKESHKGDYGHTLILAGSQGMSGASVLAALGALRGGSGLVTVATPKSQQPILAKHLAPDALTLSLPETSQGSFSIKAIQMILPWMERRKIACLALGPGISRNSQTALFIKKLLFALDKNKGLVQGIVIDADGFLALNNGKGQSPLLEKISLPIIVTPHLGEMAKFCNVSKAQIEKDRVEFLKKFAKLYRVICVLKGYQTLISDGQKTYLNPTGNPGMARGGSGDVLTGLIAALISQMVSTKNCDKKELLLKAASLGVYLHGLSGDLAKKEKTEIGMIASDIAEYLPSAYKKVIHD
ncbi:MAG: NAD(P)H-hydrate dehydratase [Elusimicrobia bacterium RIFCSPLOWO2_02_FULL_39_32]|nr:MAG: NAD(P)H-hydrate dehydratase [Elusimicrobia bacterium GWA2_38_7]OGR80783.1 MAG: NAD(P)H-hydrate dehydratase [Elusimicrobia bacterium RIFCSPHIGHO2_02_FULL_39_36]OGR93506.1 MAG: NAD(P)H-hydrate dehydratase [Elusimicrobia bacterium RIFCSPLOWO2_02_FULL_39_32]OGS00852.1 MAG: NAD(P)H-hydrate dehydratase [Elusimicrobia bacterium RIFCSPLOWO2_12_FULL_39_28]